MGLTWEQFLHACVALFRTAPGADALCAPCLDQSTHSPRHPKSPADQMSPLHKAERRFLIEHLQLMAKGKQVRT